MKKILISFALTICYSCISFTQTQTEMNVSAAAEYSKADKELNLLYSQLIKTLDPTQKAALIESEKAWLKYRDSHCKFASMGYQGGSMYAMIYNGCLTDLTEKRTIELQEVLEDE